MPVAISRTPKISLILSVSNCWESHDPIAAATQPEMIAGYIFLKCKDPCFQRNRQATKADGMKNRRFKNRACVCSIPTSNVSHSINKLPPPTPIPARKPNKVLITSITGIDSNINSACLPIKSEYRESCEATVWESFCQSSLRQRRQWRFRSSREVHLRMILLPVQN